MVNSRSGRMVMIDLFFTSTSTKDSTQVKVPHCREACLSVCGGVQVCTVGRVWVEVSKNACSVQSVSTGTGLRSQPQ
ncbi:hypothetical protein BaRGS_00032125 [Batillaria attramentaria]|uniref:Uncharacterized protein n=1 Tax=Batillaria attramentaria TaxID=370345 RepID=A0ABD0JPL0_9CAEN